MIRSEPGPLGRDQPRGRDRTGGDLPWGVGSSSRIWVPQSWVLTKGTQALSAAWGAGGTNRRAEGSLDSAHEMRTNTFFLLKQGREGSLKP